MGFKEAGQFIPFDVPDSVKNGGVYFDQNGHADYSVNHQNFRLRRIGEENTEQFVSEGDKKPIEIHPGPVEPKKVPEAQDVSCGLEAEFHVLNKQDGTLADLYNGNRVYMNGKGIPEVEYIHDGDWLIDKLKASPEGLRFQAEINTKPANTWKNLERNTLESLRDTYQACMEHDLLLLPTGLSGEDLANDWNNISAHPYILKIHSHGLRGTALTFDANTVQSHADLRPFGSSDFGLYAANIYNSGLATWHHALATSSPFYNGRITRNFSNRELKRAALFTEGGVQKDVAVDGHELLRKGDKLVRAGIIPVPERAFGSHSDTRPAKLSTGTFETGSADMSPNIDYWNALAITNRQFLIKIAEHLKGEPLDPFMQKNDFETRKRNRAASSHSGSRLKSVQEGLRMFFEWAKPMEDPNGDWQRAQATIEKMLDYTHAANLGERSIEAYFDHTNPSTYMRGNFSEVMVAYSESLNAKNDHERIRLTNWEISKYFMKNVEYRLAQAELI